MRNPTRRLTRLFRSWRRPQNFQYARYSCVSAPIQERKILRDPPRRVSQQAARLTALLRGGLALGYTVGLLFLLWSPASGQPPLFPHDDKVFHCLSFCGVGASWWWATRDLRAVWIIGGSLAVGSEVVQGLLPWPRSTDGLDMLADMVGVAIGMAIARWWDSMKNPKK